VTVTNLRISEKYVLEHNNNENVQCYPETPSHHTHTHTSFVCLNACDHTTTTFMQLLHYLLFMELYKA